MGNAPPYKGERSAFFVSPGASSNEIWTIGSLSVIQLEQRGGMWEQSIGQNQVGRSRLRTWCPRDRPSHSRGKRKISHNTRRLNQTALKEIPTSICQTPPKNLPEGLERLRPRSAHCGTLGKHPQFFRLRNLLLEAQGRQPQCFETYS